MDQPADNKEPCSLFPKTGQSSRECLGKRLLHEKATTRFEVDLALVSSPSNTTQGSTVNSSADKVFAGTNISSSSSNKSTISRLKLGDGTPKKLTLRERLPGLLCKPLKLFSHTGKRKLDHDGQSPYAGGTRYDDPFS